MKKQQWFLVLGAIALVVVLYIGVSTTPPPNVNTAHKEDQHTDNHSITIDDILASAKQKLSPPQIAYLGRLETILSKKTAPNNEYQHINHQLARFWADSAHIFEPYAYYTGEAAKLENSEKSLTFAAQLFLDNLITESNPTMQNWLATQGKVLLEKALILNPDNDSSKIGLGACYIFGNLSDNPMEGILPIRTIVQKDPDNLYGQMILALGGRKSGQYEKAIERFLVVVQKDPDHIDAMLNLAECYDILHQSTEAIKWYQIAKDKIRVPEAKLALEKRISDLKK